MWQLTRLIFLSLGHASCSPGLKQFSTTEKNKTYMYFVFVFTNAYDVTYLCYLFHNATAFANADRFAFLHL